MNHNIIKVSEAVVANPAWRLQTPIDFSLEEGENIAIIGTNGSGKTLLINTITGSSPLISGNIEYSFNRIGSQHVYDNIKYLAFHDTYSVAYYYQQRWNASELDDSPTVKDSLENSFNDAYLRELVDKLHIDSIIDKQLILLSNGELRKYQIIKTLLQKPKVLILDSPFIGLDVESRNSLELLLNNLSKQLQLSVIIVSSQLTYIPDFITHVVVINAMRCLPKVTRMEYSKQISPISLDGKDKLLKIKILSLDNMHNNTPSEEVVNLKGVTLKYDDRVIFENLNWLIKRGEKWALLGKNGAGKSTLLSLICADNPMAYACDITLFGKKRGSGESIWDIKKHIGYVSPEMHRAYLKDYTALEVVASGFTDFIGLFIKPTAEQVAICRFWMDIFGMAMFENRSFLRLSSGEQRLTLLARAFVKDPDLLVLDEPLHGLDSYNKLKVKMIIDIFCNRPNKTLIMVTHYEEDLPESISNTFRL